MSAARKPVWVWLEGQARPVKCGDFALAGGIGTFVYDAAYRERSDALALDPFSLPFTRSSRGLKETRQGGLFGVLRDASPEGFGLALLEQRHGLALTDPMMRLELSEGDAVGAIEVCDDIDARPPFVPPTSAELMAAIAALPEGRASSHAAREVRGMRGTSLGGERPKLTVLHQGQHWIAKLQDRGDPPHAPLREFVAMRLARRCGISAAPVELLRHDGREVLLVKRFDRHLDTTGELTRQLYASAHTVLRLDAQVRGERQRSYVAFAHEIRRWCGLDGAPARELQRELWRRMAFNAICGNGDDHPRNHGLVHRDGRWGLAEAFDIAPYITFSGTLSMALTRDGSTIASRRNLLAHCDNFGYTTDEAEHYISQTMQAVAGYWDDELRACGYPAGQLPVPDFRWLDDGKYAD